MRWVMRRDTWIIKMNGWCENRGDKRWSTKGSVSCLVPLPPFPLSMELSHVFLSYLLPSLFQCLLITGVTKVWAKISVNGWELGFRSVGGNGVYKLWYPLSESGISGMHTIKDCSAVHPWFQLLSLLILSCVHNGTSDKRSGHSISLVDLAYNFVDLLAGSIEQTLHVMVVLMMEKCNHWPGGNHSNRPEQRVAPSQSRVLSLDGGVFCRPTGSAPLP